jgi:hypothetical protein
LGVLFAQAVVEHEHEQEERERFSSAKNYRPPHPMDVKGGCSPQNNRENLEATKRASGWWQQDFI